MSKYVRLSDVILLLRFFPSSLILERVFSG